jgi:hypothetical protein
LRFEASLGKLFSRPYQRRRKKTFTKKGCGVAQVVGPEFKPQHAKEREREIEFDSGNKTEHRIS